MNALRSEIESGIVTLLLAIATLTTWAAAPAVFADDERPFDIPRIEHIAVDGDGLDWGDNGFLVNMFADEFGEAVAPTDLLPKLRLGWDGDGLLMLFDVIDDVAREASHPRRLFLGDSVEAFVAPALGSPDMLMFVVAPGRDPRFSETRSVLFDQRADADRGPLPQPQSASQSDSHGYRVEIRLPWSRLGVTPVTGTVIAFQAYVMDDDGGGQTRRVTWHPASDTHLNRSRSMYSLRLADAPSPAVCTAVRRHLRNVRILGTEDQAGHSVSLESSEGRTVDTGVLRLKKGGAEASLCLPLPKGLKQTFTVRMESSAVIGTVPLPTAAAQLADAVEQGGLSFYQYVFAEGPFPRIAFRDPDAFRQLMGEYSIRTRFFDSIGNEVHSAATPGRYAALVEIVTETGQTARRLFTLYRSDSTKIPTLTVPLWMHPDLTEQDAPSRPSGLAQLSAEAAVELANTPAVGGRAGTEKAATSERQWWIDFKRKLYGIGDGVPILHDVVDGAAPGPIIRGGTPADAMVENAVLPELEAVCQAWQAGNPEEGFSICIARAGIAFFAHSYGHAGTEPMTSETPAELSSLTKLLTGVLVMMFVDQGVMDLDAPMESYLPVLAGLRGGRPVTLRMLLTHTSGITGHSGDQFQDFEEIIADSYPWIESPVDHEYSGLGYALAARAMELRANQTLPELMEKLIFRPLGCEHSVVRNAHNEGRSTANDLARIGQMLLNGGTYGHHRLLSSTAVEHMRPELLTMILGSDTQRRWGIGLWGPEPLKGLSKDAFGHPSANAGCLWVDPGQNLVMAITSTGEGHAFRNDLRDRLATAVASHTRPVRESGE